jgi:hypothetical protein
MIECRGDEGEMQRENTAGGKNKKPTGYLNTNK